MTRNLLVSFAFLAVTAPARSHHSETAEFNPDAPVKVTGTIVKVEWLNPHVWFYVDVKDEKGNVTTWGFSGAPPGALMRRGITKEVLKIGSVVNVEGARARAAGVDQEAASQHRQRRRDAVQLQVISFARGQRLSITVAAIRGQRGEHRAISGAVQHRGRPRVGKIDDGQTTRARGVRVDWPLLKINDPVYFAAADNLDGASLRRKLRQRG